MTDQVPNPNQPEGGQQQPTPPPPPPPPPAQPAGQQHAQHQAPPPPPPPNVGAPQYQAQQQAPGDLAGTVVLNYWLSVFFAWLPALIFFFTEKGKSQLSDQYHRENLNFSLIRTGAMIIAVFVIWIPILGQLIWLVAWLGGLILHLLVAIKAKERFESGQAPGFLFNMNIVK